MTANAPDLAKSKTIDVDPNAHEDRVPQAEGDNPNPAAEDAPPASAKAEERTELPEVPEMLPDRRAEIANRFKAHRDDAPAEEAAGGDEDEDDGDDGAPPPPAPEGEPKPEIKEPPAAETFKVKVRGQEFNITREQLLKLAEVDEDEAKDYSPTALVRLAQKQAAASQYLDEAREASKSARTAARAPSATPAPDDADADEETVEPPTDPFEEAADKTQFGDKKESADALRKAVQSELQRFAQGLQSEKVGQDIDDSVKAFTKSNEDLMADEIIANLVYQTTLVEVRDDLVRLGVPKERIDLVNDVSTAVQAHKEARLKGLDVRKPENILEAAGARVRDRLGIQRQADPNPAPAPAPTSDRSALKRSLPRQPVRANVTSATEPQPGPRPPSSVVMNMRKSRGQSV